MDPIQRRESMGLVHMYSSEVDQRIPDTSPGYALSQTLVNERANLERLAAPWRALLDPRDLTVSNRNPITAVIADESQKLRDIWRNYQGNSSAAERLDIDNIDPTVEGITKIVNDAVVSWNDNRKESRWGRVKNRFHRFCNTIDSHSNFIKLLPESSEYVSIFSGTITAIVEASVNHEGIVEDIAQALCEIGEHVQDCAVDLKLFDTHEMVNRVSDLYSEIFKFLRTASEWVTKKKRKRFGDAFDENVRDEIQSQVNVIKRKSQRIRDHAAQNGRVEGRLARLMLEGTALDMKARDQHVEDELGGLSNQLSSMRGEILGSQKIMAMNLIELFQQAGVRFLDERGQAAAVSPQRLLRSESLIETMSIEDVTDNNSVSGILSGKSECLERFYDPGRVRLAAEGFKASIIPPVMVGRLAHWLQAETTDSSLLWLRGEPDLAEDQENTMSMLAAMLVELAMCIKLPDGTRPPLLSYFCHFPRRQKLRDGNPSDEAQGSVALLYALLRQIMSDCLPRQPSQDILQTLLGQLEAKLSELDGSLRTWTQALDLFRTVLPLLPGMSLCIVDGLHLLDDRQTEPLLIELLQALRESQMKVLFTTSGRSGALLEAIRLDETVQAEDLEALDD